MAQLTEIHRRIRTQRRLLGLKASGRGRLRPMTKEDVLAKGKETLPEMLEAIGSRAKAVAVLDTQMDHKDPGIAQKAAIKVLELTDGKPNVTITQHTDNVTHVVYETAALPAGEFVPGFGLAVVDDEDDAASA